MDPRLDPKWDIHFPDASSRPKYGDQMISSYNLSFIYTCANYPDDDGLILADPENKRVFLATLRVLFGNARTDIPYVVTTFMDADHWITKKVAAVADKYTDELLADIQTLSSPEKEAQKRELNIRDSTLPNINSRKATREEIVKIYAGACWYDPEGTGFEPAELRILLGALIGMKKGERVRAIPPFVRSFIEDDQDTFTEEVKRFASLRKDELLGEVDVLWRNHVTEDLTAPALTEPTPAEPSIPAGYRNVGSAYGAPDIRPVPGGLSTISHPSSQTPASGHGQDFILGQLPEGSQFQSEHEGLYGHQTVLDKESPPSSNAEISASSSSSRRSASPTGAGVKRQTKDEKARRNTAKGGSEKKVDEGDEKKPRDSRQKKAVRVNYQDKKGHPLRPK